MNATGPSSGGSSPARQLGIRVVLPIASILVVLGVVFALLARGSSKPGLGKPFGRRHAREEEPSLGGNE